MRRGDIYFVERGYAEGSEQRAGRPAIIVSNDKNNENSNVVEVVYLTTQPKNQLPTHVDITSAPRESIALCEQINSVFVDRLGDYIATCTEYEMMLVDAALAISLGITLDEPKKETSPKVVKFEKLEAKQTEIHTIELEKEVIKLATQRDTYKALYEGMFERLVAAR